MVLGKNDLVVIPENSVKKHATESEIDEQVHEEEVIMDEFDVVSPENDGLVDFVPEKAAFTFERSLITKNCGKSLVTCDFVNNSGCINLISTVKILELLNYIFNSGKNALKIGIVGLPETMCYHFCLFVASI